MLCLAMGSAFWAATVQAEGEAETGAFGSFRLKGTNGYSLLVLAGSKPQFKRGEILVFVGRRSGKGFESVLYLAPAMVLPDSIEADLGLVGKIAVRFEASGPPERVHTNRKEGGSATYQPGAWVGEIEIEGEEGFTHASSDRTESIPSPFLEEGCGLTSVGETGGHGVVGARLIARSATARHAVYLQVNKNHRKARVRVEASLEERRRGLIVSREVVRSFSPASFTFDPSLKFAELDPVAPFSGSASFHYSADAANKWTGNLTVDFPGRANVPLAGRRFNSALGHWKRTEGRSRAQAMAR
jgi:hypothetical protein